MGQGTVLSIGSINLDVQVRADSFPKQSETVLARDCLCTGGGKGANVALLAARLGVGARLLGRVGDDPFAALALANLRHAGVDLEGVQRIAGQTTGTSMIVVQDDGDKTIVLAPNANTAWEGGAQDDVQRWIATARAPGVLVIDLEVPRAIVRAALEAARARGLVTVVDPSPATRMDPALFALCDYLTPNPRETQLLTGVAVEDEHAARAAGEKLLEAGVQHACVKLKEGGVAWVHRKGGGVVHAPRVKVVDKTGAGDAFAGALGAALAMGRAPAEAVRFAVMASSFAVTRYGSQAAYPTRSELERFIGEVSA